MKKSIFLLIIFSIFFHAASISQTKEFTIAYSGTYPNYDYVTNSTNWSWYDELNVNLWQGWGIGELSIHGFILDSLYSHNISGYFQPDTLMQFALGKVIIHQAENNTTDNFRYRHHNLGKDTTETFMGETVSARFFDINTVPLNERGIPDTVLTGVRENAIQSFSGLVLDPKKQWRWETNGYQVDNSWYLKPRMRIDSVVAFGSIKNVVKILIRSFNGDSIYSVILTTQDFRNNSINSYDGQYLENFFVNNLISVPANSTDGLNKGFPSGLDHRDTYLYFDSCQVDFEIHWYKDVSVWIDYVKVMDRPAYLLDHPDKFIRRRMEALMKRS